MVTKPKTTITKTEFVQHHEEGEKLFPMPENGMPYILESAEFDAFIASKRKVAQREADELDIQISRLHAEIEARLARKHDLMKIIIKAETILNMREVSPTPSPQITDRGDE